MDKFEKIRLALRYYLQGAADHDCRYFVTLHAFDFSMGYHIGKRKDGVTPEFMHQLETTQFIRTLRSSLLFPAETIAVMLLHDTAEDYDVPFAQIREKFGAGIEHGVQRMTKLHLGRKKSPQQYFEEMLDCPRATLCKGADRIHNQQSMIGVFTREKQLSYIEETRAWILPMLKKARRLYPEQENAYENIKRVLMAQIEMLEAINKVSD